MNSKANKIDKEGLNIADESSPSIDEEKNRRNVQIETRALTTELSSDTFEQIASSIAQRLQKANNTIPSQGWLSYIWGDSKSAPANISGLVLLLFVSAGISVMFFGNGSVKVEDYWKMVIPVITLLLGYLFGKKL